MNDEPIFTKCGRELYEKKCVFWVTGGTSQKKHPVLHRHVTDMTLYHRSVGSFRKFPKPPTLGDQA